MRKLMEAVKVLGEDWDDERYSMKYAEVEKFQGRKIIITDLYDGDIYGILDKKHGPRFMLSAPLWRGDVPPSGVTADEVEISSPTFDIDEKDEAFLKQWYMESDISESIEEANQGGKTEHSGAKKGKGAYYGRKKDAKKDSNKNRRANDKSAVNEGNVDDLVNKEQELASQRIKQQLNNSYAGKTVSGLAFQKPRVGVPGGPWEQRTINVDHVEFSMYGGGATFVTDKGENVSFHNDEDVIVVNGQDEQTNEATIEIIGEGRQFHDSASMVRWMMGALERMQIDYSYRDDPEASFHDLMEDIDNLVEEMKDAEIKTYPSSPTHGRPRRR